MLRDELCSRLDEVSAKVSFLSWFESDRGADTQLGLYLIVEGIAEEIRQISNDIGALDETGLNTLNELFDSK